MGIANSALNFIRDTTDHHEYATQQTGDDMSQEYVDDMIRKIKVARELREQEEIDSRNRELNNDTTMVMYNQFYNQTIGSVFIWCFDTVGVSTIVYAIYETARLFNTRDDISPVMYRWTALSMIITCLVTAMICCIEALRSKDPALFSRVYMIVTKANCGLVSVISTVFTCTAWYALNSSNKWTVIFFPTNRSHNHVLSIAMVVAQNALWVVSLVLTYMATPFGAANSAFIEMPVVAVLTLMYILVCEIGNNLILICGGTDRLIVTMLVGNLFLLTSFGLHAAASFEVFLDPPRDNSSRDFWVSCRSTPSQRQLFDPWTFAQGIAMIIILTSYIGAVASSDELLAAGWVLIIFAMFVTIVKGFDVQWALRNIFDTSDELESDILTLERQFRMKRNEAAALVKEIRKDGIDDVKSRIQLGHPVNDKDYGPEEDDVEEYSEDDGDTVHSDSEADEDTRDLLREKAVEYKKGSLRRRYKTAVDMFPNIPVSLRREG